MNIRFPLSGKFGQQERLFSKMLTVQMQELESKADAHTFESKTKQPGARVLQYQPKETGTGGTLGPAGPLFAFSQELSSITW